MPRKPIPPAALTKDAKAVWKRVYEACTWDEPALVLLDALAQQWDRLQEARRLIAAEGIVLAEETAAGKTRTRAHPAILVERSALEGVTRCWKALGFDQEAPGREK